MSVILFKDGKSKKFEPSEMYYQLDQGWSVTEEVEDPELVELKELAKLAGIKGYGRMGKDKLKCRLEALTDANQD